MTINERVSDERLSTLANLQSHECMALPAGHNEVAMMARELQQYRAAAEPVVSDSMALAFHAAITDSAAGADDIEEIKTGLRAALANYAAPQVTSVPDDYFTSLVSAARARADKAMRKFPQPNYVLNKVAEENGEVIKAVIHYTEGRETWINVEGEIIDNLAMLIRLVQEGDQVIGFTPPNACRAAMLTAAPAVQAEHALQNFRAAMEGIGHIRRTLEETFGGLHGTHCEPDVLVECKAICDAIYAAYRKTGNPPVIPDDWIPVSERMPDTMISVLVTGDWFHHGVSFWDGASWCDLDFEPPVTHWMPLPAAPQQEAE